MKSIQGRLTLLLLGGLVLLSCVCGVGLYLFLRQALTAQFDRALHDKAASFAALSNQRDEDEDERRVPLDKLPARVKKTMAQHVAGAKLSEVEQVIRDNRLFYKVEVFRDGAESEFLIGAAGQYLGENDEFGFAFDKAALPEFQPGPSPEYYQVWDEDGETVARSPSLEGRSLTVPRGMSGMNGAVTYFDASLPHQQAARAIAFSFVPRRQDRNLGASPGERVVLVMARTRAELDRTLATMRYSLLISGLLLLVSAAIMVRFSVQSGLGPLDALAQQATTIDVDTLVFRFPTVPIPCELQPISNRLNELLDRLQRAFEREKRFTSDVAHELRTPIAELRSLAEVGLRSAANMYGEEELSTYLDDALAIAAQMERLINSLLMLVRCESGQQVVNLDHVQIAALLKESWRSLAETAQERELMVDFQVSQDVAVRTDPVLLGAVLTNLLSNAVAYTPRGGKIQVSLTEDTNGRKLEIVNTNKQLTQEDLAHLLEPFWRKDQARSDTSHSGLGLCVAGRLCGLLEICLGIDLLSSALFRVTLNLGKLHSVETTNCD